MYSDIEVECLFLPVLFLSLTLEGCGSGGDASDNAPNIPVADI
jgi:hypothetical protein